MGAASDADVQVLWYHESKSSYSIDHPVSDNHGCFTMRALEGVRYEVSAYAHSLQDARGFYNTMQEVTAGGHPPLIRLVLAPHKEH